MQMAGRLLLVAAFALGGCASWKAAPGEGPKPIITLSDSNNDGLPDVARYRFVEYPDGDYEILDTNYDGYFDKKVGQGYGLQAEPLVPEIPWQQVEQMAKGK